MQPASPFTDVMVEKEISVLRCLHGMLENESIATREQFVDLMRAAFTMGKLEPKKLSDELGFSFTTVYRWIEGRSAPHKSLWPRIVEWIMTAIDVQIAGYEDRI